VRVVCCTSSLARFTELQQDLARHLLQLDEVGVQLQQHCEPWQHTTANTNNSSTSSSTNSSASVATSGNVADSRLLLLERASHVSAGVAVKLWAVGKCDSSVPVHMPRNSTAVVFAVPSPLDTSIVPHKRERDVRIVDGGLLVLDPARCSPRGFCVLLPYDRVYACHAAAIVHAKMNWQHHEVSLVYLTLYTFSCISYSIM
jgi:hypothetical protein